MDMQLESRKIQMGDVLVKLEEYPANVFDTVITSPPYWALRDYGYDGQWGLENSFHDYLELLQKFMKQIKRVLKPTGSVWINIGDTYSTGDKINNIPQKSRYGIPDRFYTQCIDNDWIARNVIPWVKWNPMPTSVTDRLMSKWEYLYFFTKEKKYYFNLQAIKIPVENDWKTVRSHVKDINSNMPVQQTFEGLNIDETKNPYMKNMMIKVPTYQDYTKKERAIPIKNRITL